MSRKGKQIMKFVLVIIYLILTVSGVTLMKLGGNPGTIAIKEGSFQFGMSLVSAAGFICYICSFLLFTRIVVMFDLSYIMPLCTGITQVITLVVAGMVFKEEFTWQSIAGASAIIIGIILMNLKK